MKFLAINTAGAAVEAAVYSGGATFYKADAEFKKASAVCLPFIDALLAEAKLTLSDLDFIAAVSGPGSFTGIRIGLTILRAFCQLLHLPAVTVTYADVLSYNIGEPGNGEPSAYESVITVSDASNGFLYLAAFDAASRDILLPPAVLRTGQIAAFLESVDEPCVVCPDKSSEKLAVSAGKPVAPIKTDGSALVAAVISAYEKRGAIPYCQAAPLYVRQSQAEEGLRLAGGKK